MIVSAAKESLKVIVAIILVIHVVGVAAYYLAGKNGVLVCAVLGMLALLFTVYFFRDPERAIPGDEKIVVAPADGLVVGVEEMDETAFGLGRMKRVAIFLSVMDVHVNRAPVSGVVEKTLRQPGVFLDVRHPDCSARNEALAWKIKTSHGPVVVRQIAGLIARRIVSWSGEGQNWERGQRFGMIRFGSRTEVFLPLTCSVLVKIGDKVQGAATPIARYN